ncbi:MAG: Gfo/Idh/MocA family oxidoreductase [Chloroflexota bacterium]
MTKPRTVVIGYGMAGRSFHVYLVNLADGLSLYGVASRNPETRAQIRQEQDCIAFESFDQVLADPNVDLIVLATPNSTHADLAVRALDAGKHVVTDKIMCLNLTECDRMIAAAERSGKLLTVFQNRRWDGDYLTVKSLMDEGKLGDVRWLEMAWQRFAPPRGWRQQAGMGGGWFYDLGAHLFDQLLQLMPYTVTSVYYRRHFDMPGFDIPSHNMIVVGFENGTTGVCDLTGQAAIHKPRFHVLGTKGAFIKYGLDPQEVAMKAGDIDAAVESEAEYGRFSDGETEMPIPTIAGRWRSYYEHIADVLTHGAEPIVKLSEARRVMALVDAAQQSAEIGQVVEVRI